MESGQTTTNGGTFYWIKGHFSWRQIGPFMGRAVYPKGVEKPPLGLSSPCGLAPGPVEYKIYNDHKDYSVSKEYPGSRSLHICLHEDGICIAGSLRVECDEDFARETWESLKEKLGKLGEKGGSNG